METKKKKKESKVLAVIALIFAIIGLLGSWIPILNNIAAIFAGIGIVLGLIALLINLKKKKTLSLVSFVLAILALIIVLVTQSMYSKAIDDAGKSVNDAISSEQKKADDQFTWTSADYDALVVGDTLSGAGGANYDELVAKFGKPGTSSESTVDVYTTKLASWDNMGATEYKSVSLSFVEQADGTWLLSSKNQTGLE